MYNGFKHQAITLRQSSEYKAKTKEFRRKTSASRNNYKAASQTNNHDRSIHWYIQNKDTKHFKEHFGNGSTKIDKHPDTINFRGQDRIRSKEVTNKDFVIARKPDSIEARDQAILKQTFKSFSNVGKSFDKKNLALKLEKQITKSYQRNVIDTVNQSFATSSSKWVERPPTAIPTQYLRQKFNMKSSEQITRVQSATSRKNIQEIRVNHEIQQQGIQTGENFNNDHYTNPQWRPHSPNKWMDNKGFAVRTGPGKSHNVKIDKNKSFAVDVSSQTLLKNMKNMSTNQSSTNKTLGVVKQATMQDISDTYAGGHGEMGVSHLRKRTTQKEMTATKTIENIDKLGETTMYDLNMSLPVSKPGRNFVSVHKGSSNNVKSHAVHQIDTGVAHKSLRTLVNLKTQIEMKSANKNEVNLVENVLYQKPSPKKEKKLKMVLPIAGGSMTPVSSQTPNTGKNKNNQSTRSLTNDASRKSILKNQRSQSRNNIVQPSNREFNTIQQNGQQKNIQFSTEQPKSPASTTFAAPVIYSNQFTMKQENQNTQQIIKSESLESLNDAQKRELAYGGQARRSVTRLHNNPLLNELNIRSKHGESSAAGALRNKRPSGKNSKDPEVIKFRKNYTLSKQRVQRYEKQAQLDLQNQSKYDKIKLYPKTNQERAMQELNKSVQAKKQFHPKDLPNQEDSDFKVLRKAQKLAVEIKKSDFDMTDPVDVSTHSQKMDKMGKGLQRDLSPALSQASIGRAVEGQDNTYVELKKKRHLLSANSASRELFEEQDDHDLGRSLNNAKKDSNGVFYLQLNSPKQMPASNLLTPPNQQETQQSDDQALFSPFQSFVKQTTDVSNTQQQDAREIAKSIRQTSNTVIFSPHHQGVNFKIKPLIQEIEQYSKQFKMGTSGKNAQREHQNKSRIEEPAFLSDIDEIQIKSRPQTGKISRTRRATDRVRNQLEIYDESIQQNQRRTANEYVDAKIQRREVFSNQKSNMGKPFADSQTSNINSTVDMGGADTRADTRPATVSVSQNRRTSKYSQLHFAAHKQPQMTNNTSQAAVNVEDHQYSDEDSVEQIDHGSTQDRIRPPLENINQVHGYKKIVNRNTGNFMNHRTMGNFFPKQQQSPARKQQMKSYFTSRTKSVNAPKTRGKSAIGRRQVETPLNKSSSVVTPPNMEDNDDYNFNYADSGKQTPFVGHQRVEIFGVSTDVAQQPKPSFEDVHKSKKQLNKLVGSYFKKL